MIGKGGDGGGGEWIWPEARLWVGKTTSNEIRVNHSKNLTKQNFLGSLLIKKGRLFKMVISQFLKGVSVFISRAS